MLARNSERCGARARNRGGRPCQGLGARSGDGAAAQWEMQAARGRSTGPRMAEGRRRIAEAQRRRWENRRARLTATLDVLVSPTALHALALFCASLRAFNGP
jgi:hypothetical protein